MKVYAVLWNDSDEFGSVIAVYTSLEKANKHIENINKQYQCNYYIEEYEVN